MNNVVVAGYVGSDPRINSQKTVANLSLAVRNYDYQQKAPKTLWLDVKVFGKTITSLVEPYVSKGTFLIVNGRLEEENWTDKSGQERSRLVIHANQVSLGPAKDGTTKPPAAQPNAAPTDPGDVVDGDVPF